MLVSDHNHLRIHIAKLQNNIYIHLVWEFFFTRGSRPLTCTKTCIICCMILVNGYLLDSVFGPHMLKAVA